MLCFQHCSAMWLHFFAPCLSFIVVLLLMTLPSVIPLFTVIVIYGHLHFVVFILVFIICYSVSYTHLDVYKRQVRASAFCSSVNALMSPVSHFRSSASCLHFSSCRSSNSSNSAFCHTSLSCLHFSSCRFYASSVSCLHFSSCHFSACNRSIWKFFII